MLDRMRQVHGELEKTVTDTEWKDWVRNNTADVVYKAARVHDIVMRSTWWKQVVELTDLMR